MAFEFTLDQGVIMVDGGDSFRVIARKDSRYAESTYDLMATDSPSRIVRDVPESRLQLIQVQTLGMP